ncbi:MAG: hypothetical protein ABWY25_09070 [Paenisporosarcina sp.]
MSRKFLTAIDLAQNELQNAVAQNLPSAPSSPVKGQFYFNSTGGNNTLYWWDGVTWVAAKDAGGTGFPGYGVTVTSEQTFGLAPNVGAGTTVSRVDHTHGSPVHDVAAHSGLNLGYLPTAGGTMTGDISMTNGTLIKSIGAASNLQLFTADINGVVRTNTRFESDSQAGGAGGFAEKFRMVAAAGGFSLISAHAGTTRLGYWQFTDSVADGMKIHNEMAASNINIITTNGKVSIGNRPTDVEVTTAGQITVRLDPTANLEVATKQYVDNLVAGMSWKSPVRAATTGNITLSAPQTIDGVAVIAGDRVLVMNQTTSAQNGIYVVAAGAWTRSTDANTGPEMVGASVFVSEGTANVDKSFVQTTNAPITIDTTSLTFVQFAGGGAVTAGAGMTQSGNILNVVAGDTTLTIAADDVRVNTGVIATVSAMNTADALKADKTTAITAGAGLTGGGDLSAARTLDIVAANGSIVVGANDIQVAFGGGGSTSLAARSDHTHSGGLRYYTQLLATSATVYTVTHNLNTQVVMVQVFRATPPMDTVEVDVERTDGNTVTLRFAVAPAANAYQVMAISP